MVGGSLSIAFCGQGVPLLKPPGLVPWLQRGIPMSAKAKVRPTTLVRRLFSNTQLVDWPDQALLFYGPAVAQTDAFKSQQMWGAAPMRWHGSNAVMVPDLP